MSELITQLGYVGIDAKDVDHWRNICDAIGAEPAEVDGADFALRLDSHRAARVYIHKAAEDSLAYAGWEAVNRAAYETIKRNLTAHDVVYVESTDDARRRGAAGLIRFRDPDGNRLEVYWGMSTNIRTQFVSPIGIEFSTGYMGMGHMTLGVNDAMATLDFYAEVLEMKLSEIADVGSIKVVFMRCNPRHHSLAFAQVSPKPSKTLHVAIEYSDLDHLGLVRERLHNSDVVIARDLGRHPTDGVISLYAKASDAFDLELGWGSIEIDDQTWDYERYRRNGWSWGHRPPISQ